MTSRPTVVASRSTLGAVAVMVLAVVLAVGAGVALAGSLTPAKAGLAATRPLAPSVLTLQHSPATVTSCKIEDGELLMRGKLHATRKFTSDYTVHAQVVQNGVLVEDAYAVVKRVPAGKVVPFVGGGTQHLSGGGFECQPLDVG